MHAVGPIWLVCGSTANVSNRFTVVSQACGGIPQQAEQRPLAHQSAYNRASWHPLFGFPLSLLFCKVSYYVGRSVHRCLTAIGQPVSEWTFTKFRDIMCCHPRPTCWHILFSWRCREVSHDDVIKWKHFPRYWPFVRGIHRSPVNSPHKGQWRGALMFSLICVWINGWVNNREAGDLRRYPAHYDVTVMLHHRCFAGLVACWFLVFILTHSAINSNLEFFNDSLRSHKYEIWIQSALKWQQKR